MATLRESTLYAERMVINKSIPANKSFAKGARAGRTAFQGKSEAEVLRSQNESE